MQIEADAATLLPAIANNDTRWNSTHAMLQRALKLNLTISPFVSDTTDLSRDTISARHWEILEGLSVILEPVYRSTKDCISSTSTIRSYGLLQLISLLWCWILV